MRNQRRGRVKLVDPLGRRPFGDIVDSLKIAQQGAHLRRQAAEYRPHIGKKSISARPRHLDSSKDRATRRDFPEAVVHVPDILGRGTGRIVDDTHDIRVRILAQRRAFQGPEQLRESDLIRARYRALVPENEQTIPVERGTQVGGTGLI